MLLSGAVIICFISKLLSSRKENVEGEETRIRLVVASVAPALGAMDHFMPCTYFVASRAK